MYVKALALLALGLSPAALAGGPPAGASHQVKMVQEGKTYRFEPAELTINAGDTVTFTVVTGGPHNVAFEAEQIPADAKEQLAANMPGQISPLAGPLLPKPGNSYTITFANMKPGTYSFFCMPHLALGMKGTITVK